MKSKIKHILKKELREMFRDKKSLAMMLVIPIFIPLLVIGMSALFNLEMNVPITDYNQIGFAYSMSDTEKSLADSMNIEVYTGSIDELEKMFKDEKIKAYFTKEDNHYTIHGNDTTNSTYALELAKNYFNNYKSILQKDLLYEEQIDANKILNIITLEENIKIEDNYFASYIINYAFLFIIMAITVSATYPATDATAGEKERGTLETLLTFPIKSKDIIIGKFLSVTISSIITGLLSLILAIISLKLAGNLFPIYENMNLMLPLSSLCYAIMVIIGYSLLISGLCIAIASKCKTFKEAQSALTPLTFISFFPGMIAFMTGITTSNLLSCIPFLNYTLIFTDISNGNINGIHIILMLLSSFIIIALLLKVIVKEYKSEKALFSWYKTKLY